MPRISAHDQFTRYQLIRQLFIDQRMLFGYLSPTAQQELYRFYQPHFEHSLKSLKAHHAGVKITDPSLAHRSGKHYQRLGDIRAVVDVRSKQPVLTKKKWVPASRRHLTVHGVLRPEPDLERLARVFLALAEKMQAEEQRE